MNDQDVQDILVALLTEDSVQLGERGADTGPTFEAVSTFEEAGIVSNDKGLVIGTGHGSVFLVTIGSTFAGLRMLCARCSQRRLSGQRLPTGCHFGQTFASTARQSITTTPTLRRGAVPRRCC